MTFLDYLTGSLAVLSYGLFIWLLTAMLFML